MLYSSKHVQTATNLQSLQTVVWHGHPASNSTTVHDRLHEPMYETWRCPEVPIPITYTVHSQYTQAVVSYGAVHYDTRHQTVNGRFGMARV